MGNGLAIGRGAVVALFVLAAASSVTAQDARLVEIVLVDRLDEPRGYCLDVVGSQARATPEKGIHAHTCYSYQGRIAVDQAFDRAQIAAGRFLLPHFSVCLGLGTAAAGSTLRLSGCDSAPEQRFELTADGRIVSLAAPSLCLTVADGAGTPGGGGQPVHLLRRLTVETCDNGRSARQTWRLRSTSD